MAKNAKKSETTVTRISADGEKKAKVAKVEQPTSQPRKKASLDQGDAPERNPLAGFFGYFVGAWKELRQVRWPSRGATWSLTGAVLAFSAFFVVFILLIDALFKYIFEIILK